MSQSSKGTKERARPVRAMGTVVKSWGLLPVRTMEGLLCLLAAEAMFGSASVLTQPKGPANRLEQWRDCLSCGNRSNVGSDSALTLAAEGREASQQPTKPLSALLKSGSFWLRATLNDQEAAQKVVCAVCPGLGFLVLWLSEIELPQPEARGLGLSSSYVHLFCSQVRSGPSPSSSLPSSPSSFSFF